MLSREFLHQLEDEVNRARYEIDEKYHMGLAEVKARLAHITGIDNLKVEQTPRGDEIYILGDVTAIVQKGNNRSSMTYLAEKLSNPFQDEKKSIPIMAKSLKLQGLSGKLTKLKHDLEFDAGKMSDRIDSVASRKDAAFSKGHQYLDATETNIGEVEEFVKDLEAATNGDGE